MKGDKGIRVAQNYQTYQSERIVRSEDQAGGRCVFELEQDSGKERRRIMAWRIEARYCGARRHAVI